MIKSFLWVVRNRPFKSLFKYKWGIPYKLDMAYIIAQTSLYDCYWSVEPRPSGLRGDKKFLGYRYYYIK
jgi:hypothetical protein